jgi:hypothetical protein
MANGEMMGINGAYLLSVASVDEIASLPSE